MYLNTNQFYHKHLYEIKNHSFLFFLIFQQSQLNLLSSNFFLKTSSQTYKDDFKIIFEFLIFLKFLSKHQELHHLFS